MEILFVYFGKRSCEIFMDLFDRHPVDLVLRPVNMGFSPQLTYFLLHFNPTSLTLMDPKELGCDLEIRESVEPHCQASIKCGLRVCMPFCHSNLDPHETNGLLCPVEMDIKYINGFQVER